MSDFDLFPGALGASSDPRRGERLDNWIEEVLARELDLDAIERDEDGEIPLPRGSAITFVRTFVDDNAVPRIHVYSPLVIKLPMRPEVYQAANTINQQLAFAKVVVYPDINEIRLEADLWLLDDLSSEYFMAVVRLVGNRADYYDTRLQRRFGGETMLDDDEDELDV